MTQEDKELLLKDLSARLLYGVKVALKRTNCYDSINKANEKDIYSFRTGRPLEEDHGQHDYYKVIVTDLKPYLFPLSSMTDEQKKELRQMNAFINTFGNICFAVCDEYGHDIIPTYEDAIRITDWLNKNHFDYRGLIEKGLALDATGLNIYK